MTKTQFRLGALLILTAIFLHNLTSPDRYSLHDTGVTLGTTRMVKVDRITGKTWRYTEAMDGKKHWFVMSHK